MCVCVLAEETERKGEMGFRGLTIFKSSSHGKVAHDLNTVDLKKHTKEKQSPNIILRYILNSFR